MDGAFDGLDQALEEEAWRRLSEDMPRVVQGIRDALGSGVTPERIHRRVMIAMFDREFATTCEMAARWLQRSK